MHKHTQSSQFHDASTHDVDDSNMPLLKVSENLRKSAYNTKKKYREKRTNLMSWLPAASRAPVFMSPLASFFSQSVACILILRADFLPHWILRSRSYLDVFCLFFVFLFPPLSCSSSFAFFFFLNINMFYSRRT